MKNAVNLQRKRVVFRIIGTFGISFFSPLVSGNAAETLYNLGLSFNDTLIIAFISAVFSSGLILSNEIKEYGEAKL